MLQLPVSEIRPKRSSVLPAGLGTCGAAQQPTNRPAIFATRLPHRLALHCAPQPEQCVRHPDATGRGAAATGRHTHTGEPAAAAWAPTRAAGGLCTRTGHSWAQVANTGPDTLPEVIRLDPEVRIPSPNRSLGRSRKQLILLFRRSLQQVRYNRVTAGRGRGRGEC